MKILLIAPQPFFEIRGTPLAVRNMISVLCDNGHHVDLLTYHIGADVERENLRILRIPSLFYIKEVGIGLSGRKMALDIILGISALLRVVRGDYDCLHGVEEGAFIAAALGRIAGKRVVYDMDSLLSEQIGATRGYAWLAAPARMLERWAVRSSDLILTISQRLADEALSICPSVSVAVVEDIPLEESRSESGSVYPEEIFRTGRVITYAGSLERYQGVGNLVAAMPFVLEHFPDASCVIIGGREDQISKLGLQVATMGLGDRVHLLGRRATEELGGYLSHSDLLVSPRQNGDNIPYKIYTYMASGKPLVATRIGAHTALLDESCAFMCGTEAAEIGRAICSALSDPIEAGRRASRAAAIVEENYTPGSFTRKLLAAYALIKGGETDAKPSSLNRCDTGDQSVACVSGNKKEI